MLNCGFVSAIVINKEVFLMCPIKTNFPSTKENTMVPNLHSSKTLNNSRVSKNVIDINRKLEKGVKEWRSNYILDKVLVCKHKLLSLYHQPKG